MENINRAFFGLIPAGALKDIAKNPDNTVVMEKLDDYTFTIATGKNGDINQPVSWYLFPYYLTGQAAFMASPTWLAAADADPALETQPVGTGPFIVQEYLRRRPHAGRPRTPTTGARTRPATSCPTSTRSSSASSSTARPASRRSCQVTSTSSQPPTPAWSAR